MVDLLGAAFTGPLFVAALELWVAARTDRGAAGRPRARWRRRSAGRCTGSPSHCSAPTSADPASGEAVQATLDLLRGLGVANLLSDDSARRAALLATWKRQLATLLTP